MSRRAATSKDVPLDIAGSNTYGRYPKISNAQTYNMFLSDEWAVPFAGYEQTTSIIENGIGRYLFTSTRYNHMIAVIGENVYRINSRLAASFIGKIDTFNGDISIDENNASQIAICDRKNIYIYDYDAQTFGAATLDFNPDHITFQNGYFIAAVRNEPKWRLSALNDGLSWPADSGNVGLFQTKADNVVACIRLPSRGNQLFVMGSTVTQHWTNVGYTLFPYQLSASFNIDYGCLSPSTIATGDNFVVWLASNEKSGTVIMYSTGTTLKQISTDGINYKLAQVKFPEESYGMIFKQDGHIFYLLTFTNPADNRSLIYDFNTNKFYSASDENMDHHIARKIAFFNNEYYFVSFNDGNIYRMSTELTEYDGEEIPRVRVCSTVREPDSSPFIVNYLSFVLEQGESVDIPRVDLRLSRDGGVSFGNDLNVPLNPLGIRKNRYQVWNLGYANEITVQVRFWGHGRFLAANGVMSIYR